MVLSLWAITIRVDWIRSRLLLTMVWVTLSRALVASSKMSILGLPNRLLYAIAGSAFCVFVEILLNSVGTLTWDYSWWSMGAPWLIFLIGYLPFFLVSFWVHDMKSIRSKAITVGAIFAVDLAAILIFGLILKWI